MRLALILSAAAAAVLAGCTSAPTQPSDPSVPPEVSSLENADIKARMSCRGERPLAAGQKFLDMPLVCQGYSETVTLGQIQDAGWRLESVSIEKTQPGDREIPLSLVVRKLF